MHYSLFIRPNRKPNDGASPLFSGLETADRHSVALGRNVSHMKELVHQFLDSGTADSHSLDLGRNMSHMKELVHQFLDSGTADSHSLVLGRNISHMKDSRLWNS
jgi:hypothetical protein